jgi:hypothetical protein
MARIRVANETAPKIASNPNFHHAPYSGDIVLPRVGAIVDMLLEDSAALLEFHDGVSRLGHPRQITPMVFRASGHDNSLVRNFRHFVAIPRWRIIP